MTNGFRSAILFSSKNKNYFLLRLPLIQNLTPWQSVVGARKSIMNKIDIFICQPIHDSNKFSANWSTNNLRSLLNTNCQVIIIPNLYFKGYFPQAGHGRMYEKGTVSVKMVQNGDDKFYTNIFPWGDKFIDDMCDQKLSVNTIVNKLNDDDFLDKEFVIENAEKSIKELERREEECDVVISDFIREKYRQHMLFYSERHPTGILTKELVKRIFEKMGFFEYSMSYYTYCQKDMEFSRNALPIYPTVAKHLGLEFKTEFFNILRPLCEYPITFEEYVKLYIKTIHGDGYVEDTIYYYLESMIYETRERNLPLYIYGNSERNHNFIRKYQFILDNISGYIDADDDMLGKELEGAYAVLIIDKTYYASALDKMNLNQVKIYKVFDM